jgi:hypothetical protein
MSKALEIRRKQNEDRKRFLRILMNMLQIKKINCKRDEGDEYTCKFDTRYRDEALDVIAKMGFTRKFEEFNAIIYQKDKLNQLSVIKESFLYTTFTVDAVDRLVDRGIVKAKAERIAKEISEELNSD